MINTSRKKLRRLDNKQFYEDVKKFIKSSHEFYETRVPESKILAKRLNQEYKLKGFYKVFNKLWKTGYNTERSLAICTLELYKEEFNIETWMFMKPKLKDIKSWDKLDSVSINIIGEILLRELKIEKDILKMSKSKNIWFKRISIMSLIPKIRAGKIKLALEICKTFINNKETHIQNAVGIVLNEIAIQNSKEARKFIMQNINMPAIVFNKATENLKDLRYIKKQEKPEHLGFKKLIFWKQDNY